MQYFIHILDLLIGALLIYIGYQLGSKVEKKEAVKSFAPLPIAPVQIETTKKEKKQDEEELNTFFN
jgi:hypothetical protein